MSNIEDKIKYSCYYKYQGIAPEGFILIPDEIIKELEDFDNWKEFKGDSYGWIERKSKTILKDRPQEPLHVDSDPADDYGDVYGEYEY